MDSHVKRRLVWSFLSSWIARISSTVIQLVQLPVFLHYWTMPLYGDWLIVSAVPTYLSFSTTGFGTVAGNEMTMMVARDDHAGALHVFQSCWWLIVGLCSALILLLSGALYFLPAARLLGISTTGFGTVAGNEMTMMVARDDHAGALHVFQSCWWLIVGLCSTLILLLSGAVAGWPCGHR